MNPGRSFNGPSGNHPNNVRSSQNASFQQPWKSQYQQYSQGYYQGNNYQGYSPYHPQGYDAFQRGPYYEHSSYSRSNHYHNNSFSHRNIDHNQSYNLGHFQLNNSFQSMNPHPNNLNSSINSENTGLVTTGRYGIGVNMKKQKKKKGCSQSSNGSSAQQQLPKVKEPTVKEESSQEFYFPVKTEVISYAVCPFNAGHMMEPSKLLKHISNCKMNSQNAKHYKLCPYDPTHYFLNSEIQAHIFNCDMRKHFVVSEDWDSFDANNSTVSSFQSTENEVIPQEVKKNPILTAENLEKKRYEQLLIKP